MREGILKGCFKNKKNQKIYVYLAEGIDCTNTRDGTKVAIYYQQDLRNTQIKLKRWALWLISRLLLMLLNLMMRFDKHTVYVRELKEFFNKFEKI